jgi:dihydrofolate reductase
MKTFSVVVATDKLKGIGLNGALPWSFKGDMRWFKELTTCPDRMAVHTRYRLDRAINDKHVFTPDQLVAHLGTHGTPGSHGSKEMALPTPDPLARNAVLMGRRTWEGLPEKFKPLPGRLNGVLSRATGMKSDGTFHLWPGLDEALEELTGNNTVREIFVIGGGQVYAAALQSSHCERIYRTEIAATYACDTFFPDIPPEFCETSTSPFIEEGGIRYRIVVYERPG